MNWPTNKLLIIRIKNRKVCSKENYTKEMKIVCKICLAEIKCEATRLCSLSPTGHRQKSIAASSYKKTSYITLNCPETRNKRQANLHDCLPSLLGDGDKCIEIVYGEEKIYCVLGRLEQPRHKSLVQE
jgi:hypothetical protein